MSWLVDPHPGNSCSVIAHNGVAGCRVADPVSEVVGWKRLPSGDSGTFLAVQGEAALVVELHDLLGRVVAR